MGKGEIFILITLFLLHLAIAESATSLTIEKSPPALISKIRNYSWENGTFQNAFDLDNHFKDWESDKLSYSAEIKDKISISINSENIVSFTSSETEIEESFTINATDGKYITTSNIFNLFVGKDIISPKWFNVRKSKIQIYQEDTVEFLADWIDERLLKGYSLLIDQGPGWTYYTGVLLGRESVSNVSVEILASANETVYWKFCAEDTSFNSNCTEIQEFIVRPRQIVPEDPLNYPDNQSLTDEEDEETQGDEENKESERDDPDIEDLNIFNFEVDKKVILVSLKQGLRKAEALEITNTGSNDLNLTLAIQAIEEFVSPSESDFVIKSGESKTVLLNFNAPLTAFSKDYYGNLVIITKPKTLIIPIALNINSANIEYDVLINISERTINPGNAVKTKLIFKNNGDKIPLKSFIHYSIKDYQGDVYNFSDEELSLTEDIILDRELIVPKETPLGEYLFYVNIENEKGSVLNSTQFIVGNKFQLQALLKYSIAFFIIIILSFVSIVLIYRYDLHKKRYKSINLYLKLLEMKDLIKGEKYDQAARHYIDIKKMYGEKLSKEEIQNKEDLVKIMKSLTKKINFEDVSDKSTEISKDKVTKKITKEKQKKDAINPDLMEESQNKKDEQKSIEKAATNSNTVNSKENLLKKTKLTEKIESLNEELKKEQQEISQVNSKEKGFNESRG